MNIQKQLLCLFFTLAPSGSLAFMPIIPSGKNAMALRMTATADSFESQDFDVSQLSTESASADSNQLAKPLEAGEEKVAAAVGNAALDVVAGAPLVVGAALDYARSQLLEGESGNDAKEKLGNVGKNIAEQLQGAVKFAQEQIENEEDLSKVSDKLVQALQAKADELGHELQGTPTQVAEALKEAMESEDLKDAPGRAMEVFKGFLGSTEVKDAQSRALEALKQGMESDEMKAFQSRASEVLKATLDKAKK